MRLGDGREQVYGVLGAPTEKAPNTETGVVNEWFPTSGLSIDFDQFGKARRLQVAGEFHRNDWIQSDRSIVFGLTSHSTRAEFERVLGQPSGQAPPDYGYQTLTWRRGNYAIAADFWVKDEKEGDHVYGQGTLKWLEVSAAR